MTITFIPARKRPALPSDGSHIDAAGIVVLDPALLVLGYFLLINAFT